MYQVRHYRTTLKKARTAVRVAATILLLSRVESRNSFNAPYTSVWMVIKTSQRCAHHKKTSVCCPPIVHLHARQAPHAMSLAPRGLVPARGRPFAETSRYVYSGKTDQRRIVVYIRGVEYVVLMRRLCSSVQRCFPLDDLAAGIRCCAMKFVFCTNTSERFRKDAWQS